MIRVELKNFLDHNNLIVPAQNGSWAGRSTSTKLLIYLNDIIGRLIDGANVDSIYIDFTKAYDKQDHRIMISKISQLGFKGRNQVLIIDWLIDFKKSVRINSSL